MITLIVAELQPELTTVHPTPGLGQAQARGSQPNVWTPISNVAVRYGQRGTAPVLINEVAGDKRCTGVPSACQIFCLSVHCPATETRIKRPTLQLSTLPRTVTVFPR